MKRKTFAFAALLCAVCDLLFLAACEQPAASTSQEQDGVAQEEVTDSESKGEEKKTKEDKTKEGKTKSDDDGRIDVSHTGTSVATYYGAKYIVSDATIDQSQGEGDFGLQEVCVVRQPSAWEDMDSIGWTRNSISYTNVSLPWGSASYSYSYMNEAGAQSEEQRWSRTTEESYFAGAEGVGHLDVDGHQVAYLRSDSDQGDMGIVDMEAQAGTGGSDAVITLYTYEQRGEKCAFSCNATWVVAQGTQGDHTDEELLRMVYEPLSFAQKDEEVDAASFAADLCITNAQGNKELVISRANDDLLSYAQHSVVLMEGDDPDALMRTTVYDFASGDEPLADAEQLEVGGRTVLASVSETEDGGETGFLVRTLDAWVDYDGSTLHVEATMGAQEDLHAAIERVFAQRVTEA